MIKDEILDGFISRLGECEDIDESLLVRLNDILTEEKKPKADDLVAAYESYRRSDSE